PYSARSSKAWRSSTRSVTSRPPAAGRSIAACLSSRSSSSTSSSFRSDGRVTVLFISDLHLDAEHPETIRQFIDFTVNEARTARQLYILGDLFEAWVGDDDDDPRYEPVVDALTALTSAGVACAVMHGNRDFLIGERFCSTTGVRLLGDFERIVIGGTAI